MIWNNARRRLPALLVLVLLAGAIMALPDAKAAAQSQRPAQPTAAPALLDRDARLVAATAATPGFGGAYVDQETGKLHVWSTDTTDAARRLTADRAASSGLAAVFGADLAAKPMVVHKARYAFATLKGWHDRIVSGAFAVPGIVLTDVDDRRNRLTVGVQSLEKDGPLVEAELAKAGVPREAVVLEQVAAVKPQLRDMHRPVVGGLQIQWRASPFDFPWNRPVCTLGYNANRNGVRGYVTNSHCTSNRGSVDGGNHYQPAGTNLIALLGAERADPGLFTGGACPANFRCRFSDASWGEYTGPAANSALGRIAAPPNNSFTWDGNATLRIVGQTIPAVGEGMARIGRTTGRRPGVVTRTCVSTGVNGEDGVAILCQEFAQVVSEGGDSGSPVVQFLTATDVELAGIHWGSTGTEGVYSGWDFVSSELGGLQTF
jgi:hypothetical protein